MDWLRQIPMGQYVDGREGWLRRLDPRLKLAWSLVFLLTPVLAGPLWRLGLVVALLLLTLVSGLPRRIWWRSLLLLTLLSLALGTLSMLLPAADPPATLALRSAQELPDAALQGPSWVLFELGPLMVDRASLLLGLRTSTLIFTVIHSVNLVLISTRLTLWITVKIRVDVRSPSSREARSTISGPSSNSTQDGPCSAASGSSWAERSARVAGGSAAGNSIDSVPRARDSRVSSSSERHQMRRGRPETNVSSSNATTSPSRQSGPASTGVSRNTNDQASFRRGSSRRSQPSRPSTYCPIGICRSQSMAQPCRFCWRAMSRSASRCCLPRQNNFTGVPSKPRPSRI